MTSVTPGFSILAQKGDGQILICLEGEFDAGRVDEFESALEGLTDHSAVTVCLAEVSILDSSALGALVRETERARQGGVDFLLHAPLPFQAELIGITGLETLLDLTIVCDCGFEG